MSETNASRPCDRCRRTQLVAVAAEHRAWFELQRDLRPYPRSGRVTSYCAAVVDDQPCGAAT